jgi:hypothetical protein
VEPVGSWTACVEKVRLAEECVTRSFDGFQVLERDPDVSGGHSILELGLEGVGR